MLTIIIQALKQILKMLNHEWDTLVRKIGKQTANVLLTYIALGVLFEIFWLTLMLSLFILIYLLE